MFVAGGSAVGRARNNKGLGVFVVGVVGKIVFVAFAKQPIYLGFGYFAVGRYFFNRFGQAKAFGGGGGAVGNAFGQVFYHKIAVLGVLGSGGNIVVVDPLLVAVFWGNILQGLVGFGKGIGAAVGKGGVKRAVFNVFAVIFLGGNLVAGFVVRVGPFLFAGFFVNIVFVQAVPGNIKNLPAAV